MSKDDGPGPILPQAAILIEIERICNEFDAALAAGGRPRIEDYLTKGPEGLRDRLLRNLLEAELDDRQRAGESLRLEAYCARFPHDVELVEAVFHKVVQCRRLGAYELLEELEHGGMGKVYRARQVYLNQTVALKVLSDRCFGNPEAVARFRREMQSIGRLNHPNIVRAYDGGEIAGEHFLVMEYIEGVNLQRLVADRMERQQGPLPVGAACEVIRQAALGLEHAHRHGLVHRDIKPANLMLDRSGVVKLLDLGLAKLHVERHPPDQRPGQLTETGVTMGTADYMAPEQCRNASRVDIRADIYSLGCTLYFLLTGRPPYGGPACNTPFDKLRAHVEAPVPSLLDERADCPEDLNRILARMMAKEPGERFHTPGELADVIGYFADPNELKEWIDAKVPDQSAIESIPALSSAAIDTARKAGKSSRRQPRLFGIRRRKKPWNRPQGRWAAASLVVVIVGGLAWFAMRLGPPGSATTSYEKGPGPFPALPQRAPLGDEREQAVRADDAGRTSSEESSTRRRAEAALALLPGLNGQWWFDEMPWYLPFARQAVATEAAHALGSDPPGYLAPNTGDLQNRLWALLGECRQGLSAHQNRLLDELKALADANLKDVELPERLEASLCTFLEGHAQAEWSAADLHTCALLQHKLATLNHDEKIAQQARESYDRALKQYAEGSQRGGPLRLLCLSDSARFHAIVLGDFGEAKRRFEEALEPDDTPALFRAETLAAFGEEAANQATGPGDYMDHLFAAARKALPSEAGKVTHPLLAYIGERHAWSLMDQWKVTEAFAQFEEAYRIRLTNWRDAGNALAAVYVFHNRHGRAIAHRYRGNPVGAHEEFKRLVGEKVIFGEGETGEIAAAIEETERQSALPGRQRFARDLRERLANSMERWADCELYGGAASRMPVNLNRACRLYAQAREMTNDAGTRTVMTCKLCIVLALSGRATEAQKLLSGAPADEEILGPDRVRATLLRQLSAAVLKLKSASPDEGLDALRRFLDRFQLNPGYTDSSRRETLELQLFAAELLLDWQLEANQRQAAREDLPYLDRLLATFQGRADMLPFLRRYYALAISAEAKDAPHKVAELILRSRAPQRQASLRSDQVALLLFYFSERENLAVLLSPGAAGNCIPLNLTRRQIKEAAARGECLSLPEELVTLLDHQRAMGRVIDVSWDDTICWFNKDDGLSAADWRPIGEPLDLQLPAP